MAADLDPLQLTGRVQSHVARIEALGCVMHPEAAVGMIALREAALAEGIDVGVVSAFRDFDRQLGIWNAKCRGERAVLDRDGRPVDVSALDDDQVVDAVLVWSALPGASRHHWGTDVDVVDLAKEQPADPLVPENYGPHGVFARLGAWLDGHAGRFGFFRPYDRDRGGVQPEPWHLSYAPLSTPALERLTLGVLEDALVGAGLERRGSVVGRLGALHERYVLRVGRWGDLSG